MRRKLSFLISAVLVLSLFSGVANVFANSESIASLEGKELESSLENIISDIEKNVEIDENGIIIENKGQIIKNIDQKDINNLKKLAEIQGIKYEEPVNKKSIVEMFEQGVKTTNKEIEEGELTVLDNGSFIDAKDDDFYVQGGSTYDKSYWWGKKRYKSTYNANRWVRDLYSVGHANAATAAVAGAVFGGVGALPNGLTAVYAYNLADKVSYRNSLNNRGIIANLTYVLVFTTKSQ